jgi:predicted SnoaL-like aldol condensation-catalyzing enzyme
MLMRTLLALFTLVTLEAAAVAQLPVEVHARQHELLASRDATLAANKKLVFDFWRVVLAAHHVDRAPEFLAESYIQHNPNVATGRAAFMEFFGQLPREPVKETIDDLVSLVAEGDLVVVALRRELPDLAREGQTYTTTWFDMFRVAEGQIVEHWDYGTKE